MKYGPEHGRFDDHDCNPFAFLFAGRRGGGPGRFGPFGPGGFDPRGLGWNPFRGGPRARRGDIRAASGMLAIASFIIHYLDWQAKRGLAAIARKGLDA